MSIPIGGKVEVISHLYLGRWIHPGEKGVVEGREVIGFMDEKYSVRLEDGEFYTFAPSEIEEVGEVQEITSDDIGKIEDIL